VGYYGKPVLRLDNLHLPEGGQCLITGASGSGKTTLLYAIAGLTDVLQGSIAIGGTDIATLSEVARDHFRGQRIGMIFQTLHLVKSLSVMDNLLLASYVTHLPQKRERVNEILKALDLSHKKDELPAASFPS